MRDDTFKNNPTPRFPATRHSALLVAAMPNENGNHYYFEIMLPGSLVGLILGFVTQKYGRLPQAKAG